MLRVPYCQPAALLLLGWIIPFSLLAQDQVIPIRNWPAPLYFELAASEAGESSKAGEPRLAQIASPAAGISSGPLIFIAITPCRLMDTRGYGQTGAFGPPALSAHVERTVPIPTHPTCAIPATARAYSLNFTALPYTTLDFLSAWPTGQAYPGVSTLNAPLGGIVANAAVVPAGTSGSIQVVASSTTHLIIDINGYYMAPSALALGAGTAAAPALTFSNDANSGVYSPSAGNVTMTSAGTNRLTVNAAGITVNGDADVSGIIKKSGVAILNAAGSNAGVGLHSLVSPGSGWNTALGSNAMSSLSTGQENVAVGYGVLNAATSGSQNTGLGSGALWVA